MTKMRMLRVYWMTTALGYGSIHQVKPPAAHLADNHQTALWRVLMCLDQMFQQFLRLGTDRLGTVHMGRSPSRITNGEETVVLTMIVRYHRTIQRCCQSRIRQGCITPERCTTNMYTIITIITTPHEMRGDDHSLRNITDHIKAPLITLVPEREVNTKAREAQIPAQWTAVSVSSVTRLLQCLIWTILPAKSKSKIRSMIDHNVKVIVN